MWVFIHVPSCLAGVGLLQDRWSAVFERSLLDFISHILGDSKSHYSLFLSWSKNSFNRILTMNKCQKSDTQWNWTYEKTSCSEHLVCCYNSMPLDLLAWRKPIKMIDWGPRVHRGCEFRMSSIDGSFLVVQCVLLVMVSKKCIQFCSP